MALSNLGTIGTTPVVRNNLTLTTSDPTDVFQFQIGSTKNINLTVTDISVGDPELLLFRDNGNGFFDSGDQAVDLSTRSFNRDESINNLENAGTYFAQVIRGAASSGTISYDFTVSATTPNSTSDFSNLLPKEVELGNLSADVNQFGSVGDFDTADVYQFSLGSFEGVNITLSGLTSDADIRLIQDFNNNRIVDANEVVASSTRGGTASDVISNITSSGNYFLQVNQFSGNTSFNLAFDHFTTIFA
ncbi:PPC domain-containing protein [Nostoc sp. 'Peltigera malacea cyanobiont' DB3992]|uniref:PPC domain-containing protein n=1 Tax=Nostoc sp. 'Peltigera malacea cyanobiont' DB3992 TaxID=1206980 RepID=UPI000C053262|nr:PPC domain-containing protein [Nostoc sp. 'Peltigera malacea cyanobiont' DB3992]PHM07942.1 peptidase [Nostoc sp. 'Peltigera malacea cyanobiont' DB3992]